MNIRNNRYLNTIIITSVVIIFFIILFFWNLYDPTNNFIKYIPGLDNRNLDSVYIQNVRIGEKFQRYSNDNGSLKGIWPRFRGVDFNNIIKTEIKINENWSKKLPKIIWSVNLGEGHAAPAIYEGLVYLMDYDEKEKSDALRCFSLLSGKELWKRWYNVRLKRNHGISRTIPAVSDKYILTIGPKCHIMCIERLTGNLLWTLNLEKDYKTEVPFWYTGQCPLIDNDVAIIAPCGKALMIGVDCKTGKVLWETPNPKKVKMSHASIMQMFINNKKTYIYPAIGGIYSVSAETNNEGKILWEYNEWPPTVIAPSALVFDKNKILFTAGYGAGSLILKVNEVNNQYSVNLVKKLKPQEGIASEQQTPIFYNGFIYSILPKDAGVLKNQFVCYNSDDCSKVVWSSGKTDRFGLGPYIMINDNFLILDDDGTISLIKANTEKYERISKIKFFDGQDSWGPIAFADGYLLVRDSKKMYCIDIK